MEKHSLGARRQRQARGGRFSGAASLALATLFAFGAAATSHATPYWIAWEGDDWPENQGWTHHAANPWGGPLGTRELANGVMHLDGTASAGIIDAFDMYRPGAVDPGPGEQFVLQWGVRIDAALSYPWDCTVGVLSDEAWAFAARHAVDNIRLPFESNIRIPVEPGLYHHYEFRSIDMREYDLFIDGTLARHGALAPTVGPSYLLWGDETVGAASASSWDYVRVGVIPEPSAVCVTTVVVAVRRSPRTWSKKGTEGDES